MEAGDQISRMSRTMIDYDPHHWRSHLLDIRGSMIREILPRVVTMTAWAGIVVTAHMSLIASNMGPGLAIKSTAHALVGLVLGLLLVFRTNSSYDRFWEGRKLWGGIVNETRNLARAACVHLKEVPEVRDRVVYGAVAFSYASMTQLRRKRRKRRKSAASEPIASARQCIGPLTELLAADEREPLLANEHLPLAVSIWTTNELRNARRAGQISDYVLVAADQNMQQLIDYVGGCERIHSTPMPYAYMVHSRRALILYCCTLPFALVGEFGWFAIPAVLLMSFLFLGIEEIGVEIEDPFGQDENDLPLERICQTIERNLLAQIEPATAPAGTPTDALRVGG